MKKILAVSVGMIFLSACATEKVVVETPTEETVYEAPAPVDYEKNYLEGLTSSHPRQVMNLGKVQAIELGRLMCDAITEGTTINDLLRKSSEMDVDAGFNGAVVRESVNNFCPENKWFIDSALNS